MFIPKTVMFDFLSSLKNEYLIVPINIYIILISTNVNNDPSLVFRRSNSMSYGSKISFRISLA